MDISKSDLWHFIGHQIRECQDVWNEPVETAIVTGPHLLDIAPLYGSKFLGVKFIHQDGGAQEMNSIKFSSASFTFTAYLDRDRNHAFATVTNTCPLYYAGHPEPRCVLWQF